MKQYTMNEVQAIIDETWRRALEVAAAIHPDAPRPVAPRVLEVVDHPYHGSDAPGQPKRPWLNDGRGQRGLVVSSSALDDAAVMDPAPIGEARACEIKWHRGDLPGTMRVNETIEDGAFNVIICKNCAEAIGVREGGTLPDPATVMAALDGRAGATPPAQP